MSLYQFGSIGVAVEDESFWRRVNKDGPETRPGLGPCWLWLGARNASAYGVVRRGDRTQLAHRYSFFLEHGRYPKAHALHHCDNPPCVRPDHLFDGTDADNMADARAKGRLAPGTATAHPGELHSMAKLSEADVLAIRNASHSGASGRSLARLFNVAETNISSIVLGKTWAHVGGPIKEAQTRINGALRRKGPRRAASGARP